jgi:4-diphosphocytidyl-2-C-methyl-D-erythritol kinase
VIFRAPAKVNLSLRVLGRRADGFHEIESLFVPISLADELTIERAEAFSFHCDEPDVPADENNLVVRAIRLFAQQTKTEPHVRISLAKKIPHGAGLGGGSSDAATTLLALNEIFAAGLATNALVEMAAELGSDVPFFIHRSAAMCRGRGEIVTPQLLNETLKLVLFKPPFGVPTPWAYKQWRDSRELPGVIYAAQKFPWGGLVNDLERPVFEKYIFLAALKQWLLARAEVSGALMSGSGATVFAILRDGADANSITNDACAEFGETLWTCACETAG